MPSPSGEYVLWPQAFRTRLPPPQRGGLPGGLLGFSPASTVLRKLSWVPAPGAGVRRMGRGAGPDPPPPPGSGLCHRQPAASRGGSTHSRQSPSCLQSPLLQAPTALLLDPVCLLTRPLLSLWPPRPASLPESAVPPRLCVAPSSSNLVTCPLRRGPSLTVGANDSEMSQ